VCVTVALAIVMTTATVGKLGVHGIWTVHAVLKTLAGSGHVVVIAFISPCMCTGLYFTRAIMIRTGVNRCAIMEEHLITKKIVAIALKDLQANVAKKVSLKKLMCT